MITLRILGAIAVSTAIGTFSHVDALTCYVDTDVVGANDGSTWPDAYTELHNALANDDCTEVWVAAGIYKPTEEENDRESSFQLRNDMALYGGFPPGGGTWEGRDWATHETILSGDINNSDDWNGNSYHVVIGSGTDETAVLDGFTVSWGNANGGGGDDFGGGMLIGSGSPTLVNLVFSRNRAQVDGGAVRIQHGSSPTLNNVRFIDNLAVWNGGAINNYQNSNPTLTDVTFRGNVAYEYGGGMFSSDGSAPVLTRVRFIENGSDNGGGMANYNAGNLVLTNVIFSYNFANLGGGVYNENSKPTMINVVFSANAADDLGGGLYNLGTPPPDLINATFSGNAAFNEGGAIYHSGILSLSVVNSIVWNNIAADGFFPLSSSLAYNNAAFSVSYSLVEVCYPSGIWNSDCGTDGGNNLPDTDPLFLNAAIPPDLFALGDPFADSSSGDLRLQTQSPGIDTGENGANASEFDLAGNSRVFNGNIDLGAYELSARIFSDRFEQ